MTLIEKIQNLNAETLAWVAEDPENRFGATLVEDVEHWNGMGIFTVLDFERYELENLIWDVYKDAYGYRPRHLDFNSMSLAELQAEADRVSEAAANQMRDQEEAEQRAVEDFKDLVQRTIDLGAGDEETALRWLIGGEEFNGIQDVEHFVWSKGFLFTDYGNELVQKLLELVTFEEEDA